MGKIITFFKSNKIDLIIVLTLLLFLPLFLFNLGGYSLEDFDEAWYAEISRNILIDKQPLVLTFNGEPYKDHPPLGFILVSLSFIVFKTGEFAARFPSAILGFGSIVVLFFIGKNLFHRVVGIGASLMLVSSVWFVLRSRSGNLDSPFLFFYLITFYFALKARKNPKFLYAFSASLALLLLSKSIIGLTILAPTLPIIVLGVIKQKKFPLSEIIISIILFITLLLPWLVANYVNYGTDFIRHMMEIGLLRTTRTDINIQEIQNSRTISYLHFGIREWYYPALIALIGSFFFVFKKPVILILYAWFLVLMYGFLSNSKTEIWHIIPVYPILGLFISFFLFYSVTFFAKLFPKRLSLLKSKLTPNGKIVIRLAHIFVLGALLTLSLKQVYEFKNEIRLFDKSKSGLSQIASDAKDLPYKLYLDNTFFLPGTVFYSQKKVHYVQDQPNSKNSLSALQKFENSPFLALTEKYRLEDGNIDDQNYKILSEKDGHILVVINEKD